MASDYYDGQAHYDREAVQFFDVAHEGAHIRAVAQSMELLEHLSGLNPRSVVVVATDQIAEAAARCAVAIHYDMEWPVTVTPTLPGFVGPLDVVLVVGDAPDAETVTRAVATAAGRGAETILAGPSTGPVIEDAPKTAVVIPSPPTTFGASPLRSIAAVTAVLNVLSGHPAALDGVAEDVDEELRQLSPERDVTVNLARQLRAFVEGARIIHTGYTPAGRAVAELGAALWSARGLPSGFVDRTELPAALDAATDEAGETTDIFYDPFIDGDGRGGGTAVPVKTIVWGERDAQLAGARAEYSHMAESSEFTSVACLIARGFAATAMKEA